MIRMILWALAAGVVATALNAPAAEADQMSRTKEVVAHSIADGDPWPPDGALHDRVGSEVDEQPGRLGSAARAPAILTESRVQTSDSPVATGFSVHRLFSFWLWRVLCLFP